MGSCQESTRLGLRLAVMMLACGAAGARCDDAFLPIADVKKLSSGEGDRGPPVRIRGVVTWRWQPRHVHCIVQDETGGIWINIVASREQKIWAGDDADLERIVVGDEVEIEGRLEPGGYAPNVLPISIRSLGRRPLPTPIEVDDARFFSGYVHLRRIVVEGVVQGFRDAGEEGWLLLMERSARPFVAKVPRSAAPDPSATLVDATVRLTGVVGTVFNTRGQYLHPSLNVGNVLEVEILEPPPKPFGIAFTPLEGLAHFASAPPGGHRVRTEGTVSYAVPGECFYVQEGSTGVRVAVRQREVPRPGDQVEIAGFIDRSRDFAGLAEAVYRVVGRVNPPDPRRLSPAQILEMSRRARAKGQMAQPGDFDGCLIRFSAMLIDSRNTPEGALLLLDSAGESVTARLSREQSGRLPPLESGSVVDVTGILQIDLGERFRARPANADIGNGSVIDRLTLLIPSATDVSVIKSAPWWNARRLSIALATLAAVLVATIGWLGLLRRQVAVQSVRLAGEMQQRRDAAVEFQASLRERNRLAANLHDTLLQSLAGAGFQLDTCRRAVARADLGDTSDHLDVARRMLKHAVEELRGSVWALRTMPMAGQSFFDAVVALVAHLGSGHAAKISVSADGEPFGIPNFVAGNLLLVAQEAIRNAIHHGHPDAVDVLVAYDAVARQIRVSVADDGDGFAVGNEAGPAQGHFGVQGMRERIGSLGGALQIDSRPGEGTRITAVITTPAYDVELEQPAEEGGKPDTHAYKPGA
jgi:signal transduction histidine kinase